MISYSALKIENGWLIFIEGFITRDLDKKNRNQSIDTIYSYIMRPLSISLSEFFLNSFTFGEEVVMDYH